MQLPLNQILQGDCVEIMRSLPDKSVDLIFADPPYNLQLQGELIRPNQTVVDAVNDEWDKFDSFEDYDSFSVAWLTEARRLLKDTGTIWVIGSYHNIFRVGSKMLDLGYWVLNDVIWYKTNPMPNFRGTRFTNATETLIWAQKDSEKRRYTFHYQAMKRLNNDKQMQNVWEIPICTGAERIKVDGKKAHSTQKPEALLYRILLSSSNVDDVVLDPFFGSGTTGAVAKKLNRNFIGIEREPFYVQVANQRINGINAPLLEQADLFVTISKKDLERVNFGQLVENGFLKIGQYLYSKDRKHRAAVMANSHICLLTDEKPAIGSIHKMSAQAVGQSAYNGWDFWFFESDDEQLISIDILRDKIRESMEAK